MRYIEKLYRLYKRSIENEIKELEELAKSMNLDLSLNLNNTKENPMLGDIFLTYINGIPVYYVYVQEEDGFKAVLKLSNWWRLANQNDMIVDIDGEKWIVQTWNKFYLIEDEYKNSKYIGSLSQEDKKLLSDFLAGKIDRLPEEKRGLTVPEGNYSFWQNRFHREEAKIVKDLSLRIFSTVEEEAEFIVLPPERLKEQPLSASEEETGFWGEGFVLELNMPKHHIVLHPDENLIGKKAKVRIFEEEYSFEQLPEKLYIFIPTQIKEINLKYIGKHTSIQRID